MVRGEAMTPRRRQQPRQPLQLPSLLRTPMRSPGHQLVSLLAAAEQWLSVAPGVARCAEECVGR